MDMDAGENASGKRSGARGPLTDHDLRWEEAEFGTGVGGEAKAAPGASKRISGLGLGQTDRWKRWSGQFPGGPQAPKR